MALTSKQKRELKSLGQKMGDDARLGKAGPSDPMLAHVEALLVKKELVKLRFIEIEGAERKEFAAELAAAVEAECVAVVGRTVLLYKPNPGLDPKQRVLT